MAKEEAEEFAFAIIARPKAAAISIVP